jgi:hypothetical protein
MSYSNHLCPAAPDKTLKILKQKLAKFNQNKLILHQDLDFGTNQKSLVGAGIITVTVNEKAKDVKNLTDPNLTNYMASLDLEDAEKKRLRKWKDYEFKRPSQIYKSKKPMKKYIPTLFGVQSQFSEPNSANFSANSADGIQGNLSNCYFISPIVAMAGQNLVPRLFSIPYHPKIGIVSTFLGVHGHWQELIFDDFLPAKKIDLSKRNGNIDKKKRASLLDKFKFKRKPKDPLYSESDEDGENSHSSEDFQLENG